MYVSALLNDCDCQGKASGEWFFYEKWKYYGRKALTQLESSSTRPKSASLDAITAITVHLLNMQRTQHRTETCMSLCFFFRNHLSSRRDVFHTRLKEPSAQREGPDTRPSVCQGSVNRSNEILHLWHWSVAPATYGAYRVLVTRSLTLPSAPPWAEGVVWWLSLHLK